MKNLLNRKAFNIKTLVSFVDDSFKKDIVNYGLNTAKQGAKIAEKVLLTLIELKGLDPNPTPKVEVAKVVVTVADTYTEYQKLQLSRLKKVTYLKDIVGRFDVKVRRSYEPINDLLQITNHEKLKVDLDGFFKRARPHEAKDEDEDDDSGFVAKPATETLLVVKDPISNLRDIIKGIDNSSVPAAPINTSGMKEALETLVKYASLLQDKSKL